MSQELFEALVYGELEQAKQLISQGDDIQRITKEDKWSYLHYVLISIKRKTPIESIQFLLDKGLDVNAIERGGYTPLIFAVRQRNVAAMRLLLDNGAVDFIEHENEEGVSALRMGLVGKPYIYEVLEVLLEYGADPDKKSKGGTTVRERLNVVAGIPPEIHQLFERY